MLTRKNFSKTLTTWFQNERAHLPVPGRGDSNPYAIWVAEVMLQQTQVATVWPYFENWMEQFPSISSLADADQDQVLKSWEGLGYYSRARNLHSGAKYVMDGFDGKLPKTVTELLKIPGVGPYTAAAIASLAFGIPEPLIDGNVLRVYSRVTRLTANISQAKTKAAITSELANLISPEEPAEFNQGLMDLGRVICTPKNPSCKSCPLKKICLCAEAEDVESFPVKEKRKPLPHYHIVIGLVRRGDCFLIQKRPESGLLGGLWEFPGGKIEAGESGEEALLREIKEETGLDVDLGKKIGTINHAYTHFKITMSAWFCDWVGGEAQTNAASENKWIPLADINKYAFPKANLKVLELISISS